MYGIIGKSPSMQKLYKIIQRVAASKSTVLIQGESGTGKELIARALHRQSPRRDHPLIPVNCGAIPEDLLESELFGHVRGAFTGAAHTRTGRFELANNGTLFLDEIGDMSSKLQVKMLRVLQEKVVEPVGSVKSIKVDVRVVAATHKNLEEEVAAGRFREDLFYRLNVVPIHVPPLRERGHDVSLLVEHFLDHCVEEHDCDRVRISSAIHDAFRAYRWPGNVRELENLVERLTILADGEVVMGDLPEGIMKAIGEVPPQEPAAVPVPNLCVAPNDSEKIDFNNAVASYENQLILSALDNTGWNKNKAAQLLNLNRTTLVEKIKKKGLERMER